MSVILDEATKWVLEQQEQQKYFNDLDKKDPIQDELNIESDLLFVEDKSKLKQAIKARRTDCINTLKLSERELAMKMALEILKM